MKRWAVGIALALAVVVGGAYWLYHSLDFVVKAAIEHHGPQMVGGPVAVREVRISATDGRGTLGGIEIGNPPGYAAPRAVRIGTIMVRVDPASLGRDVVVIHEIVVSAPEITYELAGGSNNLAAIQRNIRAYAQRSGGDAAGNGDGAGRSPGRRYVIGRISLRGARVTMTNPILKGQGLTFDLPEVSLRDVGRRSGGVTAAEAASLVTGAIVSKVAQAVLTNAEALRRGGVGGALDALRGLVRP